MEIFALGLNLAGLSLQIEGVILGVYAVRNLVFRKGVFDPRAFDPTIFDTESSHENLPTDLKTGEHVSEVSVIDRKKAIFGVFSIVAGLVFQIVALWF